MSSLRPARSALDRAFIHRELIIRSELYSFRIRAAIVFTIVVFLLLPILCFWSPETAA
jgi:hypothetical protein